MVPFPVPSNEEERASVLEQCDVLDTAPEPLFDDIAQLAAQICETPMALVSLIDRTRQWFKARVGVPLSETSRASALCAHAIVANGPTVVRDTWADPRFAEHPLVTGAPYVRFYAAVPVIVDDRYALGTVCVMDRVARALSPRQLRGLALLARRVSTELSLRRRLALASTAHGAREQRSGATSASDLSTAAANRPQRERVARWSAELPVSRGAVIGDRYLVERAIGGGGMGIVALARDLRRETRVAIKFMRPSTHAQPPALRRFLREAQVLFSLDSEHVARVLDFGRLEEGEPYFVMEYLDGTDLAARVARQGALPLDEAVGLVLQACEAVQVAHHQNILHRDLKPANLFVTRTPDGQALLKVLDFGISKLAPVEGQLETALTGDATELGSPSYMSPEQMLDAAEVDVRTDVWSLGIVLYELLAGKPPYAGPNRIEICANVLTAPPPPIRELRPEVTPELAAVIARCLEKQAEQRYQTVRDLAEALRRTCVIVGH